MRRFVCCLASFVVFAAASPVAADGPGYNGRLGAVAIESPAPPVQDQAYWVAELIATGRAFTPLVGVTPAPPP